MAELQDLADRAGAYGLMILVPGLCGLRFGECAALRVRSVDLMRRRLRGVRVGVRDQWAHDWVHPETHQSRDVPIPRSLIDDLVAQSVKHVQRMLGHKDAAMALNVYASLFEDDLDDVSNRLDAALLESAGACMRPEPDEEIIELPERAARRSFD